MIRILMNGCNGKMGQVITEIVSKTDDLKIVAGVDYIDNKVNGYPVFADINKCDKEVDVVIDFSTANGVDQLLEYCVNQKTPLVLCTTGLNEEQIEKIKEASKQVAILRSANMSLGINLIMNLVAKASEVLAAADFDIEIVERHHNEKIDAPSGTALALADVINQALNNEYEYKYDRHTERKQRNKKEIGIHAVRGGNIVGDHEILYCGRDEVIEIRHTGHSKAIFANGAVSAARFLADKTSGLYDMSHVIETK